MVDTQGLGPCGSNAVGVQVPSPALKIEKCMEVPCQQCLRIALADGESSPGHKNKCGRPACRQAGHNMSLTRVKINNRLETRK